MSKVLIAAPIGDGKEYSINEWFEFIAMQDYKDWDACLCVNGKSQENIDKKLELLNQVEIFDGKEYKKLKLLTLPYDEIHTIRHRLVYARELIRQYAIENNYEYILWLDTDTIPSVQDAITRLMKHEKDVVSGLYFYKNTTQPLVIDIETKANMKMEKIKDLAMKNEIIEVLGFGYGCVLMHRRVFEKIPFIYNHQYESWSDDFIHCDLMHKANIPMYFDARVICRHFKPSDFVQNVTETTQPQDQHLPSG